MPAKTTTSAMGLPILKPRVVYLTTSATPNAVLSMKPQVPGTIATAAAKNADGTVTATYTSTNPHGLIVGAVLHGVTVSNASDTTLNGSYTVTVTSDTVFTFTLLAAVNLAGVTANATYACFFQNAILVGDDANDPNNDVFFGPNQNADFDHIPAKGVYSLPSPSGAKVDLADYYFKSAIASQKLRVQVV